MNFKARVDAVMVQWGDRLFYPDNGVICSSTPRLKDASISARAAELRRRIAATVLRRALQVMVKLPGGGRGINAIAAHFRYISRTGRLAMEDERGETVRGK